VCHLSYDLVTDIHPPPPVDVLNRETHSRFPPLINVPIRPTEPSRAAVRYVRNTSISDVQTVAADFCLGSKRSSGSSFRHGQFVSKPFLVQSRISCYLFHLAESERARLPALGRREREEKEGRLRRLGATREAS
jgi:hypothetical protein